MALKGQVKDKTGQVFGRLTVSGLHEIVNGVSLWRCLCSCGSEKIVRGGNLTSGNVKSCGCLMVDTFTTHGLSGTKQYWAWFHAKQRTTDTTDKEWANYGGRGVTMCDEWAASFETFWQDMGPTWQEGLTLDRIDVNGNYCKENCRWATITTQMHNRRKWRGCSSSFIGVSFNKQSGKWTSYIQKDNNFETLGAFFRELDAATAYDNRSEELYGDRPNNTNR